MPTTMLRAFCLPIALGCMLVASASAPAATVEVVEYCNSSQDHYFIT